jgi:signal recognition particle receptor subunit beta
LETGDSSQTHTSLTTQTINVTLPSNITADSLKYRSENDVESKNPKKFELIDTPGHAKLRFLAYEALQRRSRTATGIIYVVDAADLTSAAGDGSSGCLRETAAYLHDVLLLLQKQYTQGKVPKSRQTEILVAANKMDLFTALPEAMVKSSLEAEINRHRETRSRGIASVGTATKGEGLDTTDADDINEETDVLAGNLTAKFDFSAMQEYNISITLKGGSSHGELDASKWWDWIADRL